MGEIRGLYLPGCQRWIKDARAEKVKPFPPRNEQCLLFLIGAHLFIFMGFKGGVGKQKGQGAAERFEDRRKICNLC